MKMAKKRNANEGDNWRHRQPLPHGKPKHQLTNGAITHGISINSPMLSIVSCVIKSWCNWQAHNKLLHFFSIHILITYNLCGCLRNTCLISIPISLKLVVFCCSSSNAAITQHLENVTLSWIVDVIRTLKMI